MAPWALASAHIFSRLPEKLANDLFAKSRLVKIAADQTLFTAGDPGDGCYRVESGLMKVSVISPTGSERILAIFGPGSLIGEFAVIDGQPRSATVSTLEECEMAVLDVEAFRDFLAAHPSVGIKLLAVLAGRVRDLTTRLEDRAFLEVPARLAKQLLWLAENHGERSGSGAHIELRLSQQELGDLIGATRESVNKYLSEWTRNGVLRQARERMEIFDLEALRAIAAAG